MNQPEPRKFNIVIPTMWKSVDTVELLRLYDNCKFVDEIIAIDNDKNNKPDGLNDIQKLRIIESKENLYVNPSWNIGVSQARNELIAISNDDILFEPNGMFSFVSELDGFGAIGMSHFNFGNAASEISIEAGNDIGLGWGCLMFVNKSNWINIPENIKVWFGDNWIARTCEIRGLRVMKIRSNCLIKTSMSTTSRSFNHVIENDILEWSKL